MDNDFTMLEGEEGFVEDWINYNIPLGLTSSLACDPNVTARIRMGAMEIARERFSRRSGIPIVNIKGVRLG